MDRDGNCVSLTHSLGRPSGVVTEGLGFMYDGCMEVFDPRPGRAGLVAIWRHARVCISDILNFC